MISPAAGACRPDNLGHGRGRLRGENDNDYVDIGTNQDRGVVNQILDGKRLKPDTSRFDYD